MSEQLATVSIIIPFLNEADGLADLVAAITQFERDRRSKFKAEYLFVDDGSPERELVVGFFAGRREDDIAFVSIVALVEFVWLLTSRYAFSHEQMLDALSALLKNAGIVIEREDLVVEAVERSIANGAGIADQLVAALGREAGCGATLTFDRQAAKRIPGMELLK